MYPGIKDILVKEVELEIIWFLTGNRVLHHPGMPGRRIRTGTKDHPGVFVCVSGILIRAPKREPGSQEVQIVEFLIGSRNSGVGNQVIQAFHSRDPFDPSPAAGTSVIRGPRLISWLTRQLEKKIWALRYCHPGVCFLPGKKGVGTKELDPGIAHPGKKQYCVWIREKCSRVPISSWVCLFFGPGKKKRGTGYQFPSGIHFIWVSLPRTVAGSVVRRSLGSESY